MPETPAKRLVILIDEDKATEDAQSNILRLKEVIRDGSCVPGHSTLQISKFHVVAVERSRFSDKLLPKSSSDSTADLVKTIVHEIFTILNSPEDELWLFGSGLGGFVALSVASIIHWMGSPNAEYAGDFDKLFDTTCSLVKAQQQDDCRNGPQLLQTAKSQTCDPSRIRFIGLFDAVKSSSTRFDVSLMPSVEILRHALAMNETQSNRIPEILKITSQGDDEPQSLLQAWFLGTNDDMRGGTANDGLSLYPLQWILHESLRAGLSIVTETDAQRNSLALVFPQCEGKTPKLDGPENTEWVLQYSSGVCVSMFDVQDTHAMRSKTGSHKYALRLDPELYRRKANRKVFVGAGLKGWLNNRSSGTIIHPSVFCVLDRYPRYLDLANFLPLKANIAKFQGTCLADGGQSLAPWLDGMQLQASGVKAFRILVCGKTGVGKSTLINRVFGVEMTAESDSYNQGVHDINIAFESPRHPGLLVHDSRGWQAGSETELELVAKFLKYRASQQDPAKALHVIWFCVESDVSRIEEADKRTFATIAKFSYAVPVFVIGTKKDKVTDYRKMHILQELMKTTNDFNEASKVAERQANEMAENQFAELRNQLSQIEHYKADGHCYDDAGIKDLVSKTLDLITDDRVRLYCVAAQVVDVEQKINSAITECMRLGTHAIRTSAVPLPFSGIIGTPTVSRLICEHVLQCFGFPRAMPAEVERVMSTLVMGNLKKFMAVALMEFVTVSAVAAGVAVPTAGIGVIIGAVGCIWGLPTTARMLLKCSCDMILILERSFRYEGKYVSVKQIEDAARYYTTDVVKTFSGKEKRLQQKVHDEIDQLVPLNKVAVAFKFNRLRSSVSEIVYSNRFDQRQDPEPGRRTLNGLAELPTTAPIAELPADSVPAELDAEFAPGTSITRRWTWRRNRTEPSSTYPQQGTQGKAEDLALNTPELEGDTLTGEPREELEGSAPTASKNETKTHPGWRLSSLSSRLKQRKSK